MILQTVKGSLVNDHINTDKGTMWLTKDSKCKCEGFFLLKKVAFEYELLRVLQTKEE